MEDGRQWWGQCFLEGFASRHVLPGQIIRMDVRCLDCGDSSTVQMRDDEIINVDPETAVGIMNQPLNSQRAGVGSNFF